MADHRNLLTEQQPGVLFLDLQSLKVISALGRGAKGVVFLAESENGELFALKTILKESIQNKKKLDVLTGDGEHKRICTEKDVLALLHHPLLPKLRGVLSTDKIIGYAIDYCPGRDLNTHRKKQTEKMFSDDIIRFYAAEIVLALEYLHELGIVYRDLKPENVMIQENGHLMLVDFDLSTRLLRRKNPVRNHRLSDSSPRSDRKKRENRFRFLSCCRKNKSDRETVHVHPCEVDFESDGGESDSVEKSNSFVGTEEYIAPEIISGDGHDFSVDWWCLGVLLHEMLYGVTPFKGENRKETFFRILTRSPPLHGEPTPLRDLIRKLLEKDPQKRISVRKIKSHDFFKSVNWDRIFELPRPPYIPVGEDLAGNKHITDVESFVERLFNGGEDKKTENVLDEKKGVKNASEYEQNEEFLIF